VKKAVAFAELHTRMSCEHLRQLLHLLRSNAISQRLHGLDVIDGDAGVLLPAATAAGFLPGFLPLRLPVAGLLLTKLL